MTDRAEGDGGEGGGVAALLFDLGRVVLDIDVARTHARWAELAGLPVAAIERRSRAGIGGSAAFHAHERGEISDAAFFEHVRRALDVGLTDAQLEDGWNRLIVGEMPGIRPVLARAQQALPLFAFTNTNAAHQAYWSARFTEVLAPFRRIYASNELGARKPEVAAYRAVAADMGVAPERILFFDDKAENVAGARTSGMRAVQVTAVADIERTLNALARSALASG
jgi:putative hydrolase of the HAD superfamily